LERPLGGDGDFLFLAGAEILGADVEDAVGVDVEGDLDLRHAARGGGMPSRWKLPRSCCREKSGARPADLDFHARLVVAGGGEDLDLRVGMVVLRSIIGVATPPAVSMPSVSGVTSSRSTSLTSPLSTPPWMAAPMATTSSGLTPWCGRLAGQFLAVSTTLGMRVMPPTSTSSSIFVALSRRPSSSP
jgi:hypothetical protein